MYNLQNLHCTSHICWLHSRNKVNSKKALGNLGTAARAHRAHGFHFLLVKCVLKCGVDHTWRRTSASLNYERFHGHQVKLKKVHFTPSVSNLSRFQVHLLYTWSSSVKPTIEIGKLHTVGLHIGGFFSWTLRTSCILLLSAGAGFGGWPSAFEAPKSLMVLFIRCFGYLARRFTQSFNQFS